MGAEIMRRVVTVFSAEGIGQMRAGLSVLGNEYGNLRGKMEMTQRAGGMLDKQMQALRTTLRYAFSGAAVYGSFQMLQNFSQFSSRLGEISTIATGKGGMPLVNKQIDELGRSLIQVSNDTTQPIEDLQQGVLALYSTIGNVQPNKAAEMMQVISKTAIAAQSDVVSTTNALLGMVNAFGRPTSQVGKFGDEFFKVIQQSAGMTGQVFAGQLGRLSSSAALGNFTPEQMNALAIAATRSGGSPSVNMMGLSQLMLYLMHPPGKKQEEALAGIGLGTRQRQQLGGWGSLMKLLQTVNARGGVGMSSGLKNATDDSMSLLEENGLTGTGAGLTKGGGSELISKVFGRIQSQRIAAVFANLLTPKQVAGTTNQTLDQYLKNVTHSAGETDKAMARAMDYRRIQQASNAMKNFGIEMGSAMNPLFKPIAMGMTGATGKFEKQDPATQIAMLVGGGAGLALLLRKMGGAGRGIRGVGLAGAALDTMSGGQVRGDSPLNPLYVAVVYSLSGPGSMLGGRGILNTAEKDAARAGGLDLGNGGVVRRTGTSRGYRIGSAISRNGRLLGGLTVAGMTGGFLAQLNAEMGGSHQDAQTFFSHFDANEHPISPQAYANRRNNLKALFAFQRHVNDKVFGINVPGTSHLWLNRTPQEQKVMDAWMSKQISAQAANNLLRGLASQDQMQKGGFHGLSANQIVGKATVDITVHDPQNKKKGAAKVSLDMFPSFTPPAPQTKAKPTTKRSG